MRFTTRLFPSIMGMLSLLPATPLHAQVAVVLTPQGTVETARSQYTGGYSATFRVTNETPGTGTTQFQITCNSHGPVVCDSIRPTTLTLNNGSGFQNVTAYYAVGATGTGQLVGRATAGAVSDTGYRVVPVVPPAGAPRVDFSFWLDSLQPLGRCAASCFAAAYSQSTVPYFTLDAARGVTLVYQGDRVGANTFVLLDVRPDTTVANPSEYQLGIKFGSIQYPFINGDTILHFAFPASNGTQPHRLGGQFKSDSTSNFGHGVVFPMEIQVSSKISGTLYTNRYLTRYLSVNEVSSPIARGWTVAGVQRAWIQSDGSLMITDGTGNVVYFGKSGSAFVTPTGEFSKVTSVTGGYVRAYADSLKVFFNAGGGIVDSVKDRFGNRTYYQYDGSGRLQYIWDPIMQLTTLTYGTYGLSSITDASGRVTTFTVPSNRTLTAITDPDGFATTFGYAGNGRLSTVTNRNGATTTLGYDSQSGKLAAVTSPAVPIFGSSNQSPLDSLFNWHKRGVPYSTTLITPFTIPKSDTIFGRVKDPEGHVTRFTVNRWGQPAQTTNALSKVTTVRYTAAGLPDSVVGPGYGAAFDRVVYNADGLPTATYLAAGDTTLITYSGWAQPTIVRTRGVDSTKYFIGINGRIDSVAVGGGPTLQRMTYDSRGRVLLTKNALGDTVQSITYRADGYQNTQLVVRPGPRISRLIHDTYGRLAAVKDSSAGLPDALTWYSAINRVDSTQSPAGWKTYFKYDSLYLRKVILPSGISYKTDYNALGWPIRTKDAQDRKDSLMYNRDGLLVRTLTRRSLNVDLSYDAAHRPTQRAGTSTVTWVYDDDNLKVIEGSSQSTDTVFSNLRGQPTRVVTVLAGRPYTQTFHYLKPGGLLDSLRITGLASDSFVTRTYSYDTQKGTLSTIGLRSQTTNLEYDTNENVTRITYPFSGVDSTIRGGLTEANQHKTEATNNAVLERWMGINAVGQFDRHLKHAQKIGRWFTYDSLGQLRQARTRSRTPDAIPGGCPNYDYGMSGACTPDSNYVTLSTSTYLYGAIGNRLDLSANYDSTNTRITFFNNCNYTTDAEGNTTRRATGFATCPAPIDSLVWNAEGQLTRLVFPSGVKVAYYYDAAGRVVRKDSAGVARAYFLWSGDHLLAELNSAATTKAAEYAYYPGMDNPQALIIGQTMYRSRLDGLGSVIALTDSAGAKKREYAYDDWGLSAGGYDSASFNNRDRVRWKSALWMGPEADLYFMRNRWYEPATGRFLSEDPIGLGGGANLFAYANNDPVAGHDPLGLQGCCRLPDLVTTVSWTAFWALENARNAINSWYGQHNGELLRGVSGSLRQGGDRGPRGGGRPGSGPGKSEGNAQTPIRTPSQCFMENTAPVRGAAGQIVGAAAALTAATSGILGKIMSMHGTALVSQGTVELDLFFGARAASSALIDVGIGAINSGLSFQAAGSVASEVGLFVAVGVLGFAGAYSATSYAICAINPEY